MSNKKNWNGILIIDEIIIRRNNKIIYKENHIKNIFHASGQYFFLKILFKQQNAPKKYYIGLDNRASLTIDDTLNTIEGEPIGKGYARQVIESKNFEINKSQSGNYRVIGPTLSFSATTSQWGPVRNLFLTNVSSGTDGFLVSSARLAESITLTPPDTATLKFAFSFSN